MPDTDAAPDEAILVTFPQRPDDRLRLALRRLDEALAEQKQAVAAWRAGLSELASVASGLDGAVTAFRTTLDGVAESVRHAGDEARRLERTADAMLAAATPGASRQPIT
jgi:hypothetical protein